MPSTFFRVLACWLVLAGVVRAESVARSSVVTDYTATLWADADGHPVGAVSSIVQDRDGYLWVGSTAGLFRFDGVRFTSWNQLSDARLPGTWVSTLLIANDGTLWVGFGDESTIAHIRGRSADVQTLPGSGPVAAITQDRDGTIWTAAAFSLYRLDAAGWTHVAVSGELPQLRVHDVTVARNGHVLVSTERGVFEHRAGRPALERIAEGYIWSVGEDSNGRLWVTDTGHGFKVFERGHQPRAIADALGGGYRVMFDRSGHVWLGTIAEGLWRIRTVSPERAAVDKATLRSASFSDAVHSLFEDRDGNVWVGTTAGLHRLNRQLLQSIPTRALVSSVDATAPGGMWATTPYGISRLDLAGGVWTETQVVKSTELVRFSARDKNGTLWVTVASGGLQRLAGGRLEPVDIPREFGARPRLTFLVADPADGFWMGDGVRVAHWNGRAFVPFAPVIDGATPAVSLIAVDAEHRVWALLADGRLGVQPPDGAFRVLERPAREQSAIHALSPGTGGRLWVATDDGIAAVVDGVWRTANPDSSLPASRVSTLVEDGDGYLWADTGPGLLRVRPEEFDRASTSRGYRAHFEFFDASDGAAGAPTITSRSGRSAEGRVWFVRSGALTVADPRLLKARGTTRLAPVIIDNIKVNERTYAPTASMMMASDTKRVQIEFTTVALSKSTRVRYRYRLDGLDSDWVDAAARHTAVYTNLPPRPYRFFVQAGTDEDGWQNASTAYAFEVHPAFYQTNAFAAAAAGALALLLFAAWRIRVGFVRRRYDAVLEERMRLSREIHDTLLQGVVGVALQLDNVSNDRGMPASSKTALQDMRDQVEAYIREARQSIFDLRSPLLEEHDLVGALREVGRRAVANTDVGVTITTRGQSKRYAARLENELLRIAQEAMTNAVRHAQASHIVVAVGFDPTTVSVEVSDDGRGLTTVADADDVSHIGLVSMKERAESMGGRVTIRRSPEGGTAIVATLPSQSAA